MSKNNPIDFEEISTLMSDRYQSNFLSPPKSYKNNVKVLILLILIVGLAIIGRIFYLQIIRGNDYRMLADNNRLRIEHISAPRGLIYDRYDKLLAHNIPGIELVVAPPELSDHDKLQPIVESISKITNQSVDDLNKIIDKINRNNYETVTLVSNLSRDQVTMIQSEINNWPGFALSVKNQREYLDGLDYSHILGYLGAINYDEYEQKIKDKEDYYLNDDIGRSGLELQYESILRGITGKKEVEVDAAGQEKRTVAENDPKPGNNLTLTIDADLQKFASETLNKELKAIGKTKGAIVILNPNNGEVLSLVSAPNFDNNLFIKGMTPDEAKNVFQNENQPLFNRVISGQYPPGSTFKTIIASAALQDGVITENTTFLSTGGLKIGQWFFPDWKAGGHGLTNVTKAIAESVNTFFYLVGGGRNDGSIKFLGIDKIKSYAELFGLNKTTGIDLPGEKTGFLPTMQWKEDTKGEKWYIGDTYHAAIGQGDILATPLQMANYYSAIINGGTLYKPYLVKKISYLESGKTDESKPEIIRQGFIDSKNLEIVRRGMRQTVLAGSARSLQAVPMEVAGKTGTAQAEGNKGTHAWFAGFAPYKDPQLAVIVLIENGGEGSSVAVPVAKDIFTWYYNNRISKNVK